MTNHKTVQKTTTTNKIQDISVSVVNNADESSVKSKKAHKKNELAKEVGGPKGLEPTRYGDWEAKGRCFDF